MKKVLILSNMYPNKINPSYGIFVQNIEVMLKKKGFDVSVIAIKGKVKGRFRKLLAYMIFYLSAFFTLMFTKRVIYLHYVAHTSLPLLLAARFRRFTIISHVHGGDVMEASHVNPAGEKVKQWLARRALNISSRVVVPSDYFRDYICRRYAFDVSDIVVSPSGGVDTMLFSPKESSDEPQTAYISIGYVGRLDSGKGVDTLLKAVQQFSVETPHIKCHIVGDGKLASTFKRFVKEHSLQESCLFYGEISQTKLTDYFRSFDYFIFPTELDESLGLVGLEAMACGLPIVTTGRAGINQYFINNENGFKFTSGDSAELLKVLKSLPLKKSDEYVRLSANARDMALRFDKRKVEEHLAQIFLLL